jgi:hypothetical protein
LIERVFQIRQNNLHPALGLVHHKGRYDALSDRQGTLVQLLFGHPIVG